MRRRWTVNGDAVIVIALLWFFGWMVVSMACARRVWRADHWGHDPRGWMLALWLAPFALALAAAILWGLWRWARSSSGWLVRRVHEPVTEDLRERG